MVDPGTIESIELYASDIKRNDHTVFFEIFKRLL